MWTPLWNLPGFFDWFGSLRDWYNACKVRLHTENEWWSVTLFFYIKSLDNRDLWFFVFRTKTRPNFATAAEQSCDISELPYVSLRGFSRSSLSVCESSKVFPFTKSHVAFFFFPLWWTSLKCLLELLRGKRAHRYSFSSSGRGTSHKLNISVFSHTSIKVFFIFSCTARNTGYANSFDLS